MNEGNSARGEFRKRWLLILVFAAFDIFAVNISYYVTLLVRFQFSEEFYHFALPYMGVYRSFAPYYTVLCIVIFALFKLYAGEWKYAGLSDMNRVLFANVCTCVLHVIGTVLVFRLQKGELHRMPLSYYGIGAAIQLALILISRFTYRVLSMEVLRYSRGRNGETVNAMVIGAGESAKNLIRLLLGDRENLVRPVCIIDCRSSEKGRLFDGIPIAGGVESIREATEKYAVKSVIIADTLLAADTREQIKSLCAELSLETQDFSGYNYYGGSKVTLLSLMEIAPCPVRIENEGRSLRFDSGEQAKLSLPGKFLVRSVKAHGDELIAEIEKDPTVLNNTDEEWIKALEKETGEQISFF